MTAVTKSLIAGVSLLAIMPGAVHAQQAQPAAPAPAAAEEAPKVQEIIVTGTSKGRVSLRSPVAITSLGGEALERLSANSQADILASVPALKAEGGGGEVAANVFVAGLPSGGQYQFTPLEFNGLPTVPIMGLNSSAPDIYRRPDLGVDRLEFVRGGVSNLFGAGGIGGIINYIDKKGGDSHHGELAIEAANHSRVRADFALNGPIADGLHYAMSGWYRYDEGPVVSGFAAKGYQLRGNISRDIEGGAITLYAQVINDRSPFYGDIPLNGATYKPATGNNGGAVLTTETSALSNIAIQTPGGTFHTNVGDGVNVSGYSFGADFKKDFGEGWGLNGRVNIGAYDHSFALFNGGDNVTNLPTTQTAFLQSYATLFGSTAATFNPANYTSSFTFANSGAAVPTNYLLWGDRVTDRSRHISMAEGELNLTRQLTTGAAQHTLTLGGYFGQTSAVDFDVTYSYIGDFDNAPQLINARITNTTTGATTILSSNGLVGAGIGYTNNAADAKRYAVYAADQIEAGKWVFDIGGRYEKEDGHLTKELSQTVPGGPLVTGLAANTALSSKLTSITWGSGQYLTGNVQPSSWAIAAAALYRMTDSVSLFANASRGFFMPELRGLGISANGTVQSFQPEIIKQFMGGVKFRTPWVSGTTSLFYVTLDNRRNVQLINGSTPGSPATEVVNLVSTRAYGLEATGSVRLIPHLTADANLTYEHATFTQYTPVAACSNCAGNREARQPDLIMNGGLYYKDDRFDVALFDTFTGRTFTSDLNNIRLAAYNVLRLDAGVNLPLGLAQTVRVGVSVYNLLNNQGATEGNPRQGTLQNAGQAYFIGRDVLPRRVSIKASLKF